VSNPCDSLAAAEMSPADIEDRDEAPFSKQSTICFAGFTIVVPSV
jgi:hypothetical protein